jgi:hypothetical protein
MKNEYPEFGDGSSTSSPMLGELIIPDWVQAYADAADYRVTTTTSEGKLVAVGLFHIKAGCKFYKCTEEEYRANCNKVWREAFRIMDEAVRDATK